MEIQHDKKEIELATNEIESAAKEILKDIGMKIFFSGFNYWVKAVTILIEEKLESKGKVKIMQIYEMVADECYSTTTRVERSMRDALNQIEVDLNKYFNVKYKVHNSAFLFLLKDKIFRRLETLENLKNSNIL